MVYVWMYSASLCYITGCEVSILLLVCFSGECVLFCFLFAYFILWGYPSCPERVQSNRCGVQDAGAEYFCIRNLIKNRCKASDVLF